MATSQAERVRTFFDGMLPAIIAQRHDVFDRARGSLAIHVDGAGAWVLAFGDHESETALVEEASLDADCVCIFTTDAFVELLDGRAPHAAPVVLGDEALIEQLGQLLQGPAKGGLGARLLAR